MGRSHSLFKSSGKPVGPGWMGCGPGAGAALLPPLSQLARVLGVPSESIGEKACQVPVSICSASIDQLVFLKEPLVVLGLKEPLVVVGLFASSSSGDGLGNSGGLAGTGLLQGEVGGEVGSAPLAVSGIGA